jgi:phage terminase large subunit-like protein
VRFYESLRHTKGRFYGQLFELLPWQKPIVQDVYGTVDQHGVRQYKTVYVEIPKKNGKSELAAGAGLFHTFADGERNGEVYGCAADRSQASIVFDVAVDMIDQLPALQKRTKLTSSQKTITDKVSGTFYKVVSSEAYSKHGLNISAVIFDELHAQPNRDLWDVMTFGAGDARLQPIWWVITTAGDDPDRLSVGWEQHEYAMKILAGDIVDPTWYPVIFGYEPPENEKPGAIYDEELWKRVNPSLGHTITIESVREAAEKAKQKPADERLFRWLRLNQWITTKLTTWLPIDLFDKTVGEWNRMDLLGKDCYMGLDLSTTTDLSSLALVFPPQGRQLDWRVIWESWIPAESLDDRVRRDHVPYDQWLKQGWITATPGDVVDYNLIESRILDLAKLYNVIELDADRAFATMLLQRLETAGITCVDVPQTYVSLTDPMNQTEILLKGKPGDGWGEAEQSGSDEQAGSQEAAVQPITGGRMLTGNLTHEADPVARWAFGNTSIAKNGQGFIKFVKEHKGKSVVRTKRIDPIAALINAMARARFYTGSVDLSAAILDDDWGM